MRLTDMLKVTVIVDGAANAAIQVQVLSRPHVVTVHETAPESQRPGLAKAEAQVVPLRKVG
jgi:hypothetical protein